MTKLYENLLEISYWSLEIFSSLLLLLPPLHYILSFRLIYLPKIILRIRDAYESFAGVRGGERDNDLAVIKKGFENSLLLNNYILNFRKIY